MTLNTNWNIQPKINGNILDKTFYIKITLTKWKNIVSPNIGF